MFPINLIEELVKPFTLALRLFGNLISGVHHGRPAALLPAYILWVPQGLWKLIDAAVGVIQAFIFALLTILYFAFATTTEDHDTAATRTRPHDCRQRTDRRHRAAPDAPPEHHRLHPELPH